MCGQESGGGTASFLKTLMLHIEVKSTSHDEFFSATSVVVIECKTRIYTVFLAENPGRVRPSVEQILAV